VQGFAGMRMVATRRALTPINAGRMPLAYGRADGIPVMEERHAESDQVCAGDHGDPAGGGGLRQDRR
jgi:hypothetical protein